MLQKLTNLLTKDALRLAGFGDLGLVSVIPVATGMAITLTILALKASRPSGKPAWLVPMQKPLFMSFVKPVHDVAIPALSSHMQLRMLTAAYDWPYHESGSGHLDHCKGKQLPGFSLCKSELASNYRFGLHQHFINNLHCAGAEYMLWPRVDQKTCLKSQVLAGVQVVPMPMKRTGDQLCTDVEGLDAKVSELGAEKVLGIVTTTSCFTPVLQTMLWPWPGCVPAMALVTSSTMPTVYR